MAGRASLARAEPGFSLPFFDRLAPAPPPALVAARIESHTGPGDVVLDIHGRGGWIAHAAIGRQRRAVSLEASPLTRLLAELVLRPPDLRHLDAAFQAMAASPRRQSSLKNAVGEPFATRCPTCERMLQALLPNRLPTIREIRYGRARQLFDELHPAVPATVG